MLFELIPTLVEVLLLDEECDFFFKLCQEIVDRSGEGFIKLLVDDLFCALHGQSSELKAMLLDLSHQTGDAPVQTGTAVTEGLPQIRDDARWILYDRADTVPYGELQPVSAH